MGAKALKDMKSWQLGVLGVTALSGTALALTVLGATWPLHHEAMHARSVFSWAGIHASWALALIASPGLMFAAIARRCAQLLYQRHLD